MLPFFKFPHPLGVFTEWLYPNHSASWFMIMHTSIFRGGVPLISGFPKLGIVWMLSSPPLRLLLQLNIRLCLRHNALLRAWAHCWQEFDFGHFNLPENLGGQLKVTWALSDRRQVLTRCRPWGAISNLSAWCPTLPPLSLTKAAWSTLWKCYEFSL